MDKMLNLISLSTWAVELARLDLKRSKKWRVTWDHEPSYPNISVDFAEVRFCFFVHHFFSFFFFLSTAAKNRMKGFAAGKTNLPRDQSDVVVRGSTIGKPKRRILPFPSRSRAKECFVPAEWEKRSGIFFFFSNFFSREKFSNFQINGFFFHQFGPFRRFQQLFKGGPNQHDRQTF